MKKIVVIILLLIVVLSLRGQTFADDASSWAEGWKAAFSEDGRRNWKSEFTVRYSAGFVSEGPLVTGGVRIDNNRTLGLMLGQGNTYDDAAPADIYHIQTAFFIRRYFHLGARDVVALYSDIAVGASWLYKVDGKYWTEVDTGAKIERVEDNPGDVRFHAAWEPGVRFRFYKNLHLFLGPTVATDRIGLHLGVGF